MPVEIEAGSLISLTNTNDNFTVDWDAELAALLASEGVLV